MRRAGKGRVAGYTVLLSLGGLAVMSLAVDPAGAWLADSETAVPSDLIVVLAGGAEERVLTAIDLYKAGAAPAILITSPEGFPDAHMRRMRSEGIPSRALLAPLRPSRSTWEDAIAIRHTILREDVTSILAVTSSHHCRRARLILKRVLADLPVRVTVTQSRSLYPWPAWRTIPPECVKLLWAWLTVPIGPPLPEQNSGPPPASLVY